MHRPDHRLLRRGLPALLALVVLTGVTACSDGGATSEQKQYVALGDSFAAGPGIPAADGASASAGPDAQACGRSTGGYPFLVAAELSDYALTDVSCSGAPTSALSDYFVRGTTAIDPQLDAVGAETDLVTVSLGGNDFGFVGTLFDGCVQLRASDPTGSPCRAKYTAAGTDRLDALVERIADNVSAALQSIHDAAPGARVIVVGYPVYVRRDVTCPARLPLADGDVAWVHDLNARLVEAVRGAAQSAGDTYVDTDPIFRGHDICSDDPWINGRSTTAPAAAYHPFEAGEAAVAAAILSRL